MVGVGVPAETQAAESWWVGSVGRAAGLKDAGN